MLRILLVIFGLMPLAAVAQAKENIILSCLDDQDSESEASLYLLHILDNDGKYTAEVYRLVGRDQVLVQKTSVVQQYLPNAGNPLFEYRDDRGGKEFLFSMFAFVIHDGSKRYHSGQLKSNSGATSIQTGMMCEMSEQ